jgi:UDP-2,3-diacylglucosamine pyrophosphatase LpxH|tara:strand:- start:39765 stop:40049 length:285 start_codon:yes stop_codon:yes gene_type:complete
MYAVFGGLHGDLGALVKFLEFVNSKKNIEDIFFTGDFFGLQPDKDCEDIFKERERQYREIRQILQQHNSGRRIYVVTGNYDRPSAVTDIYTGPL